MKIQEELMALQDAAYRDFNAKLIPNIPKDTVVGVRTPALKQLARTLYQSGEYQEFLQELPHRYFEENQLHAFLIAEMKDYDTALEALEGFLPFVDNWATCDQLILKSIAKNPERVLERIPMWLESDRTYTVRFAMGLLLRYFLDARFEVKYLEMVARVTSEEHYVNMMSAWYFATALAKQYEATLPYITQQRLPLWVHNKSIQKARESFRVSEEHKNQLKALVRKNGRDKVQ